MKTEKKLLTNRKKILFCAILFIFCLLCILAVPAIWTIGFYAYQKLTLSLDYSGSYGQLDDELGWVLKPNASATMSLNNKISGKKYYLSKIYTNSSGFRDRFPPREVSTGAIVTVGDSWTFGYCVNHEETYPYFLEKELATTVINLGIPCYSAAQVIMHLKRHLDVLKPRKIIFLDIGLYGRSDATQLKDSPKNLLAPAIWWNNESKKMELLRPEQGYVPEQAKKGFYPSGFFTSGYDGYQYLLYIRPKAILQEVFNNYASWRSPFSSRPTRKPPERHPEMFKFILTQFIQLAKKYNSEFIFIDPGGVYAPIYENVVKEENHPIQYIGRELWEEHVYGPARLLPPEMARVPGDGHFAQGINKLIAKLLARKITNGEMPRLHNKP